MSIAASVGSLTAPTVVATSSVVLTTRSRTYGSVAPVSGAHDVGDIVYSDDPATLLHVGWVCTVAGTPGTWKTWGGWAPPLVAPTYTSKIIVELYTSGATKDVQFFNSLAGQVKFVVIEGQDLASPPAGWTKLVGNAAGTVIYKRLTADANPETCSLTGLNNAGGGTQQIINGFTISGCTPSGSPVDVYSSNYQAVNHSATATAASITTTVENTLLLFIVCGYDYQAAGYNEADFSYVSAVAGPATTEIYKIETNPAAAAKQNADTAAWYGVQAVAGASAAGTIDVTTLKDGGYVASFLIALKGA